VIRLYDNPGICWPTLIDHGPLIDRSQITVDEYWRSKGFEFVSSPNEADLILRKAELSSPTLEFYAAEQKLNESLTKTPSILFIGEPRELAPAAYEFADPRKSLAVAPGNDFQRMYFGRSWGDPQIENWSSRIDRFVWIGRPIGHRLSIAKRLLDLGVPLDIYSREPWPFDCWKGPAKDDVETARTYKFRIACENSNTHLYHSEKLFTSIKSGCVSFYWGDPQLDLSFVKNAYVQLTPENLSARNDLAPAVLEGMSRFMFSKDWEVYSIREFIDRAALMINAQIAGSSSRSQIPVAPE